MSYKKAIQWNLLSTFSTGICGFLVLLIIGAVYGPEVLGSFNQVYAFYMFFSQFGILGIHLSLLKHLAEYDQDKQICGIVFTSGIFLSAITGFSFSVFLYLSQGSIGKMFSQQVGHGVAIVSIGVFFFSLNKAFFSSMVGLSLFKEHAFFQIMRFFFTLGTLCVLIIFQVDGEEIPSILPVAEGLLFFCLLFFCRGMFNFNNRVLVKQLEWGRRHLCFGFFAFGGHILLQINTRIDVLFLGFFSNDKVVGIYSMGAILAEAAYQLPIVFRTVYSPDIVKFVAARKIDELLSLVRRSQFFLCPVMLFISVGGYLFIDLLLPILTGSMAYHEAAMIFLVIMVGITIASGYIPLSLILLNGGFPGIHSFMMLILVLVNVIGNFLLVPLWGALGAAYATAFANICLIPLLKVFSNRYLDIAL